MERSRYEDRADRELVALLKEKLPECGVSEVDDYNRGTAIAMLELADDRSLQRQLTFQSNYARYF